MHIHETELRKARKLYILPNPPTPAFLKNTVSGERPNVLSNASLCLKLLLLLHFDYYSYFYKAWIREHELLNKKILVTDPIGNSF